MDLEFEYDNLQLQSIFFPKLLLETRQYCYCAHIDNISPSDDNLIRLFWGARLQEAPHSYGVMQEAAR